MYDMCIVSLLEVALFEEKASVTDNDAGCLRLSVQFSISAFFYRWFFQVAGYRTGCLFYERGLAFL